MYRSTLTYIIWSFKINQWKLTFLCIPTKPEVYLSNSQLHFEGCLTIRRRHTDKQVWCILLKNTYEVWTVCRTEIKLETRFWILLQKNVSSLLPLYINEKTIYLRAAMNLIEIILLDLFLIYKLLCCKKKIWQASDFNVDCGFIERNS